MWLECTTEETDDRGHKTRKTEAGDTGRGIPQGAPISPLLANVYMRRFLLAWKKFVLEQSLGAKLVTYADDLVRCQLAAYRDPAPRGGSIERLGPDFVAISKVLSLAMPPISPDGLLTRQSDMLLIRS
jgi:hypothetical protein